jgi:hypothetical protein
MDLLQQDDFFYRCLAQKNLYFHTGEGKAISLRIRDEDLVLEITATSDRFLARSLSGSFILDVSYPTSKKELDVTVTTGDVNQSSDYFEVFGIVVDNHVDMTTSKYHFNFNRNYVTIHSLDSPKWFSLHYNGKVDAYLSDDVEYQFRAGNLDLGIPVTVKYDNKKRCFTDLVLYFRQSSRKDRLSDSALNGVDADIVHDDMRWRLSILSRGDDYELLLDGEHHSTLPADKVRDAFSDFKSICQFMHKLLQSALNPSLPGAVPLTELEANSTLRLSPDQPSYKMSPLNVPMLPLTDHQSPSPPDIMRPVGKKSPPLPNVIAPISPTRPVKVSLPPKTVVNPSLPVIPDIPSFSRSLSVAKKSPPAPQRSASTRSIPVVSSPQLNLRAPIASQVEMPVISPLKDEELLPSPEYRSPRGPISLTRPLSSQTGSQSLSASASASMMASPPRSPLRDNI